MLYPLPRPGSAHALPLWGVLWLCGGCWRLCLPSTFPPAALPRAGGSAPVPRSVALCAPVPLSCPLCLCGVGLCLSRAILPRGASCGLWRGTGVGCPPSGAVPVPFPVGLPPFLAPCEALQCDVSAFCIGGYICIGVTPKRDSRALTLFRLCQFDTRFFLHFQWVNPSFTSFLHFVFVQL